MNIRIKHISNTYNYGSLMMATTLIKRLNEEIDNIQIYIDAATEDDLNRVKRETGINKIKKDNIGPGKNIAQRIINKIRREKLNLTLKKIEIVIIIGGDDISEYYGVQALENELNILKEESKTKKIILLGQTIGPFSENRGEMARKFLQNTQIYTRDDECFDYLNKLNFKNIKRGRDLAFLDLPMQDKRKNILSKYNLKSNEYITIVPSGLTKCYTNNSSDYINEQINIIKAICNNKKIEDKKIVLLPHVLLPENVDDRLVINQIMNNIDITLKDRIIAIYDEMLPSEAREILGMGLFTITGRMHAAVSTFYMRKPTISLSYSVKYSGVIGHGLDMNKLVIESANDNMWKNGLISKLVNEKIEFIIDNYDELIEKIDLKVTDASKLTEKQLNCIIKDINGDS